MCISPISVCRWNLTNSETLRIHRHVDSILFEALAPTTIGCRFITYGQETYAAEHK